MYEWLVNYVCTHAVEALGISNNIPAFLDPSLTPEQLRHGVSFASASSGYDEMTASFSVY